MTIAFIANSRPVRRSSASMLRSVGAVALLAALSSAVWFQRTTIVDAGAQLRNVSLLALSALALFALFERLIRADIVRSLINAEIGPESSATITIGRAATLHDVGTAASKTLPLGGAVGTALRWSVARHSHISIPRFTSTFVAYGLATTLATWLLPLVVLIVDVSHASGDRYDWVLIVGISTVLGIAVATGWSMLRSDRVERWLSGRVGWLMSRVARRLGGDSSGHAGETSAATITAARRELNAVVRRPWSLVARTVAAQCSGAVILLISLRSLGVGDELGVVEFFRVYFVAQLLGSFIPTPGGIGVVEAGLTGALAAAGVDLQLALAAVLVFRLITYVLPIVVGVVLYARWRVAAGPAREVVSSTVSTRLPEVVALQPEPTLAVAS